MLSRINALIIMPLVCALIAVAAPAWGAQLREGEPFPDLNNFNLEGEMPQLEGKVVLVDFWASWCGPCKGSFPVLDRLQEKYGDRGFVIVGVSVDEDAEAMRTFLVNHPVDFATVRDADQKLVAAAGIRSMPTSFMLDRDGVIRSIHNGFHEGETEGKLEDEIEELIE
jgi:thiol-disulfide isomerase/thioredoxin